MHDALVGLALIYKEIIFKMITPKYVQPRSSKHSVNNITLKYKSKTHVKHDLITKISIICSIS